MWEKIETAPKNEIIDIYSQSKGRCTDYKFTDLGKGNAFYEPTTSGYSCIRDATHWMPRPKQPSA
jgi:hypothetical protein